MESNIDILHEAKRLRLLAAALELQHYTSTAANLVRIPDGDRVIVVGTPAQVARLLEIGNVVAGQPAADPQSARADIQRIGCEMSNVLFNLAQKAGEPLEDRDCDAMDKLRKDWDSAYRALKTAEQKGGA
jgi:hypothetical protein